MHTTSSCPVCRRRRALKRLACVGAALVALAIASVCAAGDPAQAHVQPVGVCQRAWEQAPDGERWQAGADCRRRWILHRRYHAADRVRTSCYGRGFFGGTTASGRPFTRSSRVVAHRTLPFGTVVDVFAFGRHARATVQDRGPFVAGRVFDVSDRIARDLGQPGCDAYGTPVVRVFVVRRRTY